MSNPILVPKLGRVQNFRMVTSRLPPEKEAKQKLKVDLPILIVNEKTQSLAWRQANPNFQLKDLESTEGFMSRSGEVTAPAFENLTNVKLKRFLQFVMESYPEQVAALKPERIVNMIPHAATIEMRKGLDLNMFPELSDKDHKTLKQHIKVYKLTNCLNKMFQEYLKSFIKNGF